MQEQVPSNINPEQGWSQMKVILDREMPVNRRSRRIIFLWRSLMAVGILTAFSFLLWDNAHTAQPVESPVQPKQELPATPAPQEDKKPAEQQVNFADATTTPNARKTYDENHAASSNRMTGNTAANSSERKAAKSSLANSTPDNIQEKRALNKTSPATGTTANAQKTEAGVEETSSSSTLIALHAPVVKEVSAMDESQPGYQSPDDLTSTSMQANTVRNGQVTQGIPGLDVALLDVEDKAFDLLYIEPSPVMIIPVRKNKQLLGAYVSTGTMAAQHNGAAWQGGAGLSIKALPKLRVSAGGSYRTFSPDFRSGEKDPTESLDGYGSIVVQDETYLGSGVSNYVNDFSLSPATDYQAVEPLVKTIRQWQVDAGLSYDISKRWFIQAGASYALQTTAISAVPILADAINFNQVQPRFGRSLENYNIIREHMVSVSGGVGYHIGRNFDIYAQVDHGINPYLESEPVSLGAGLGNSVERTDYIRGVTLGIKYRWL